MVVLHYSHLIDGVLSLDLDIHGDKEGKEEEDPAGEGHQLWGWQLRVWPHPRLNFTILKRSNCNKALSGWANILQQGMLRIEFLRKQLYPGFGLCFLQSNLSPNQQAGLLFRMVLASLILPQRGRFIQVVSAWNCNRSQEPVWFSKRHVKEINFLSKWNGWR